MRNILKKARQAAEASAAKARQVRNQEIALTMWPKGLDMDLIIEVTGMSKTALRKLVEMETN